MKTYKDECDRNLDKLKVMAFDKCPSALWCWIMLGITIASVLIPIDNKAKSLLVIMFTIIWVVLVEKRQYCLSLQPYIRNLFEMKTNLDKLREVNESVDKSISDLEAGISRVYSYRNK